MVQKNFFALQFGLEPLTHHHRPAWTTDWDCYALILYGCDQQKRAISLPQGGFAGVMGPHG